MSVPKTRPVSEPELQRLTEACRKVGPPQGTYGASTFENDFLGEVMSTVLDLQMRGVVVATSIQHFRELRQAEVRTLEDLDAALARYPDDREGNRQAAQFLWGNNLWTRVRWLRGFVRFLLDEGLTDHRALLDWAQDAQFRRDFAGRAKFLGIATFQSIRMRLGIDTVKPDVHLRRFVEPVVGHSISDEELIRVIEEAASRLGVPAQHLDLALWEYQRGRPGTI